MYGGSVPLVLSDVYLFAANTTGYGNSSVSLLKQATNTIYNGDNTTGTFGDYYVSTGANGTFSIAGDYTCTPGSQLYLYVYGGRPAGGNILANTGNGLLAAIGTCTSPSGLAATYPHVVVNEASTIATAYAIAGFATDAIHVSSSGSALAQTGIANAFANVTNLYSLTGGGVLATTPGGNGVVPQTTLNTLANILASCVNSNDGTVAPLLSAPCQSLFAIATSDGTSNGTSPSDTATAAINIAHHPGANIKGLFGLSSAYAPFAPTLKTQPRDFTIGINFDPGSVGLPASIAIDGAGNVWGALQGSDGVSKYSSLGVQLAPAPNGYGAGAPGLPSSIAIDPSGNVWTATQQAVGEISSGGIAISPSAGYASNQTNTTRAVAIDGSGNAWVPSTIYPASTPSYDAVLKLSPGGGYLSGAGGYSGGGLKTPIAVAIDGFGSAWVVNSNGSSTLSKISSSGAVSGPYNTGGLSQPRAVAIDNANAVWVPNYTANSVSKISSSGGDLSSGGFTGGGLSNPIAVALDGADNVWVSNESGDTLSEFSNAGVALSPATGYLVGSLNVPAAADGGQNDPSGMVIDGSGNIWVASGVSSSGATVLNPVLTEVIGIAVPVVTPVAGGLPNSLGTRP